MELMMNIDNVKKLEETKNSVKAIDLNMQKEMDLNLYSHKSEFEKIINNVIDKGTDYIIKAMPVHQGIKDILIDVKRAFKTKDFKEIVKTAIGSSIREGIEIIGMPINVIKDINKLKDITLKGGIKQALTAGIDIISNKYVKGNLMGDIIKEFFDKVKNFVKSNMFGIKLDQGIKKIESKTNDFIKMCKKWYEAYDSLDVESINDIAKKLNKNEKTVSFNEQCLKDNRIIQNMTSLINAKKDKLSQMQLQICQSL